MELGFYICITAVRFLYAQKWKDLALLTMEECLGKMIELAEVAKLISLLREKRTSTFTANQKPLRNIES